MGKDKFRKKIADQKVAPIKSNSNDDAVVVIKFLQPESSEQEVSNTNNNVDVNNEDSISSLKPATAEQIIKYLKLIDDANIVFTKVKNNYAPQCIIKIALHYLIIEFDPAYAARGEKIQENFPIFKYWRLLALGSVTAVLAGFYVMRAINKKHQEEISFLPYFTKDITQELEKIYAGVIDEKKIIEKIKDEESYNSSYIVTGRIIDFVRLYQSVEQILNLSTGFWTILNSDDSNALSLIPELLKSVLPINICYEIFYALYQFKCSKDSHLEFLKKLKEWSHSNLWEKIDQSSSGNYFFDLSIAESQETIDVSLNKRTYKIPVKVFLRELTTTFLQMGLPVIFFNNNRLVIHDWHNKNIRNDKSNLLHLEKCLILWHKIYLNKNRKLKQLEFISKQLMSLTPDHQPLEWAACKYRTNENLPAIYFSTDVSHMEKSKVERFLLELTKIYGGKVSLRDNYIIIDGVRVYEEKINISLSGGQTITTFEMDKSKDFCSTSQYRLSKSEKNQDDKKSNENDNSENNQENKVDEKILAIKSALESKYPGHVVVPLNVPKKDEGREFSIVEEAPMKKAIETYSHSYTHFINSLKNTSRVKSNNRGNGSSSTGLVGAIEPYRELDGSWAMSKRKFKLSKNSRVFFKSISVETINDERVEISKATGFNPKYHRGRK